MSRTAKNAVIIMVATLLSRVLGFLRETILANFYGTSMVADVFVLPVCILLLAECIRNQVVDGHSVGVDSNFIIVDRTGKGLGDQTVDGRCCFLGERLVAERWRRIYL